MTQVTDEVLLDLLDKAAQSGNPADDIKKLAPELTNQDAYRLQLAYKKRLAKRGDAHVGYRVSMTSRVGLLEAAVLGLISQEVAKGPLPPPVFTALSASNLAGVDRVVHRPDGCYLYAEAEVGMVIDKPLAGPGVTPATARAAVGAVYPCLDMAGIPRELIFTFPHMLASACSRADTTIVVGTQASPPTLDLRTEGILVSVDGQPRASATAWETLGGPLNCVVWLANKLAEFGEKLEPGQIIITGVCAYPQRIQPGEVVATAEFTRLGTVSAVIAD